MCTGQKNPVNVENILQSLTLKSMQALTNLFLFSHQLCLTSGLRVLDNGLGFAVYGSEESIGDYALLASDKKAALPSQVHELCHC